MGEASVLALPFPAMGRGGAAGGSEVPDALMSIPGAQSQSDAVALLLPLL